ncbi:heme NO-binding domain-containing protein [Marivita sp. XM-24bin2]|uniref:heme NO-binding domain-containing protein n=1 Tax=unclassified Marivita TaxID=2632480 RepID=UPI000D7AC817|nr:heme NO-binding domain-containing protein [Marivita sp. XM-24bin2]MCR9110559.1 heme NO-binding domain-containing protein [Paracoccaceae bacterium]PWL35402.1 MAG: heme NO-binding protein [Marivita sp. XM-24bin2]
MHGLIFRTLEAFVSDTFGPSCWGRAVAVSGQPVTSFEAMLQYDKAHLPKLLHACAEVLDRPQSEILEDLGTYLITRQNHASVRRLLRFGGQTFSDLLHALDDLPDRTRMVVPGLELPQISVREPVPRRFTVQCTGDPHGFGHVLVGLLRAMADDYGTLALLAHLGDRDRAEVIDVTVVETAFADDRGFSLADAELVGKS